MDNNKYLDQPFNNRAVCKHCNRECAKCEYYPKKCRGCKRHEKDKERGYDT